MASDDTAQDQTCTPCRGTGQLISGLGGEPHQVVCPWCRGTGQRIQGLDAQDSPAEGGAPGGADTLAAATEGGVPGQDRTPPVT